MKKLLLVMVALVVIWAVFLRPNLIDNPQYASWATHNVGTKVILRTSGVLAGGVRLSAESTQILKEISPQQVAVDEITKLMLNFTPQEKEESGYLTAKIEKGQEGAPQDPRYKTTSKSIGRETLTIDGKSYDCTIMEFTTTKGTTIASGKSWMTPLIPGAFAKVELTMPPPAEGTTTTIVTKIEDK